MPDRTPTIPLPVAATGVLFASICFGLVPYFSRGLTEAGLAPHAIAFYRYITAALILLPLVWRSRADWSVLLWGLAAGVIMGLGWVGYVTALDSVPTSTVGVLYMTYPVFTILIAWALFGEIPSRRGLVAAGLIVLAAVIAGSPAAVPVEQIPTLLVSLSAPFGFGFGICVLVHRLARIAPLARIGSVSLGSIFGLLPLVLASESAEVFPTNGALWVLVAGIGLVTALVPQLIYTVCSPVVGTTRTAVIGSVELPTMFAVGLFAFGEVITPAQAVACMLVLGAIAMTQTRSARKVADAMARQPR